MKSFSFLAIWLYFFGFSKGRLLYKDSFINLIIINLGIINLNIFNLNMFRVY